MRIALKSAVCFLLVTMISVGGPFADDAPKAKETPKPDFPPIDEVIEDGKKMEGFFNLYKKKESLFLEVPSSMLEKPFMLNVSFAGGIAQGYLVSGMTGFETILYWKVADNKLFLVDKNVRHVAGKPGPISSAVEEGFADSVIAALPIKGKSGGTYLVDIGDFLFTDYAEVGRVLSMMAGGGYSLDRNRTTWGIIKTFPHNVEVEVAATYATSSARDIRTVSDARSIPVTTRFSFSQIPQTGYKPRMADNRIGYFLSAFKDYSKKGSQEPFVRYINRWNLQKADPSAEVSPPKKPIVFYIEKSVPYEYRPIVREGILEWNKAYEKAGFVNAIEVRYQEDDAEWDAEDVRYNTVRWMTGEAGYAIGPSRKNPQTGEIYDADILVDSGWLNYFEWQYETFVEEGQDYLAQRDGLAPSEPLTVQGLLERAREKYGEIEPSLDRYSQHRCDFAEGLREQMAIGAVASLVRGASPTKKGVPPEFIRQGMKELISHEIGHTLGLRHNFKSSAMIPLDKLNDKDYAERNGLVGSVMDYSLINIAPEGVEQGYYFTPTLGKWDYLAIEYGYKEFGPGGGEDEQLAAVASIASTSPYFFGTDGDAGSDVDPLTNTRDMTDDPIGFAEQRTQVIAELFENLVDRVIEDGEGYQKVRSAFLFLLRNMQMSHYHASRFVGGFYVNRDQKGDPEESPALEVVPAAKQRESLAFVCNTAFSDDTYGFGPELISRLTPNRWDHWGSSTPSRLEIDIHQRVLTGQMRIIARLFSSRVLQRVHEGSAYFGEDEDIFTLDEIYNDVSNAIWSELGQDVDEGPWSSKKPFVSSYRRDLQRSFLKTVLLRDVLNPSSMLPQDARAVAWVTLGGLKSKIDSVLEEVGDNSDTDLDALSLAHLKESQTRIAKALESAYSVTNY